RLVESVKVKELVGALLEDAKRTELTQEDGVEAIRQQFVEELHRADATKAARLEFLFAQDLYTRAVFSDGKLTAEKVRFAAEWARNQLATREKFWPLDQSADRNERVYLALRQ